MSPPQGKEPSGCSGRVSTLPASEPSSVTKWEKGRETPSPPVPGS